MMNIEEKNKLQEMCCVQQCIVAINNQINVSYDATTYVKVVGVESLEVNVYRKNFLTRTSNKNIKI